ncbi:MAG: hypothetical protein QOD35_1429, partial [Nocardioidaceae bacterium]|nr:hypothetical protein [Nocardioidaceae bacterium]
MATRIRPHLDLDKTVIAKARG